MAGDIVGCQFFFPHRRGRQEPDRCKHPKAASYGRGKATGCLGLAGLCFDKRERETEIRRLRVARREADRPVYVILRSERRQQEIADMAADMAVDG